MQCVVLRIFEGAHHQFAVGELVDASEWRNRDRLISQRYLRPATAQELEQAVSVEEPEFSPPKVNRKRR